MNGITWTETALDDLKALHGWLGRDSKPLADRVLEKIFDAIEQVIPFPRIGRVVSEVGDESVRELLFRTFRIVDEAGAQGIVRSACCTVGAPASGASRGAGSALIRPHPVHRGAW